MIDQDYFKKGLNRQVKERGGYAVVVVNMTSGGELYVRDVVETHQGFVMLNVWVGSFGMPIVSPSSNAYVQEVPSGYNQVALPYQSISWVNVMEVPEDVGERVGFQG